MFALGLVCGLVCWIALIALDLVRLFVGWCYAVCCVGLVFSIGQDCSVWCGLQFDLLWVVDLVISWLLVINSVVVFSSLDFCWGCLFWVSCLLWFGMLLADVFAV